MLSEVQSDWSQDYFDDRYHNFKSTIFSSGNVHVYRLYLHLRVGEAVLIFLNAATPILLQKIMLIVLTNIGFSNCLSGSQFRQYLVMIMLHC